MTGAVKTILTGDDVADRARLHELDKRRKEAQKLLKDPGLNRVERRRLDREVDELVHACRDLGLALAKH